MFWAIVIVLLCICGMLLEVSATNLILAPILAPIAVAFGIGPIQFGLVLVFRWPWDRQLHRSAPAYSSPAA